jgi:hypothetical protein
MKEKCQIAALCRKMEKSLFLSPLYPLSPKKKRGLYDPL